MGMTEDQYLANLQALLPLGSAWPHDADTDLTRFLSANAIELARVSARADQLLNEADPRTTSELLTDWERIAGLPDTCVTADLTVDQRRASLVSKLTSLGGQSRAYFIALASSLGYPNATIDEYQPMNCNDNCNDVLNSGADRFVWQINLAQQGGTFIANCNSTCDSPLQAWGDETIECQINRYRPAHTNVIFAYA